MKRRPAIALLLMVPGIAGLMVLGRIDPAGHPWFPKCLFHELTGLHCAGCGTTRAVHALLQFRVAEALSQNPLLVLSLPLIVYWAVIEGAAWVRGDRYRGPRARCPAWAYWPLLLTIFGYWILRNVPVWPFTLLAPH